MKLVEERSSSPFFYLDIEIPFCHYGVATYFENETVSRQFGTLYPLGSMAAPLHSDGIPRVDSRIQDERDSKSLVALALKMADFSEGDAPKSLASQESAGLRTRLSRGASLSSLRQGTALEAGNLR
jgi:hypothetical protein